MEWTQTLAIIGVNAAMIGALATLIVWVVNKLDGDIKSICTRMDRMDSRLDGHAQRIDQLYSLILDILKQGKK